MGTFERTYENVLIVKLTGMIWGEVVSRIQTAEIFASHIFNKCHVCHMTKTSSGSSLLLTGTFKECLSDEQGLGGLGFDSSISALALMCTWWYGEWGRTLTPRAWKSRIATPLAQGVCNRTHINTHAVVKMEAQIHLDTPKTAVAVFT